jgi:hypothetical protein
VPDTVSDEVSLPFSIAFQDDLYYPYTEGPQKFRLYNHPVTTESQPTETNVGRLTEVYVYADEDSGFKQPVPAAGHNVVESE